MFKKKLLLAGIINALCLTSAYAANPLSVHVLNLQNGLPSQGVSVSLEKQEGNKWVQLSSGEIGRAHV